MALPGKREILTNGEVLYNTREDCSCFAKKSLSNIRIFLAYNVFLSEKN